MNKPIRMRPIIVIPMHNDFAFGVLAAEVALRADGNSGFDVQEPYGIIWITP